MSILQRIRELVVQASNGTNSPADRNSMQNEISMLIEEVDRIAGTSEFNQKKLLDGSLGEGTDGLRLQVGANAGDSMLIVINNMGAEALGIEDIDVTKGRSGGYPYPSGSDGWCNRKGIQPERCIRYLPECPRT